MHGYDKGVPLAALLVPQRRALSVREYGAALVSQVCSDIMITILSQVMPLLSSYDCVLITGVSVTMAAY